MMKRAIETILTIIPLLAPIPAAWVVLQAAVSSLRWPWPVAGIAALTVEGLGFISVNLAQRMYTFNHTLRMDEKKQKLTAPTWQAILVTIFYLAVTITMITMLDISSTLARFIPAIFPLLGITGAGLWAIHSEQEAREQIVADYRKEKKQEREQRRHGQKGRPDLQQVAPATQKLHLQVAPATPKMPEKQGVQVAPASQSLAPATPKIARNTRKQVHDEALLAFYRDNPDASDGQVAERFQLTRQAIQRRRQQFIEQGVVRMNGHSVEIIGISVDLNSAQEQK